MLSRLRMLTAGESHGPALVGILDGLPAGLTVDRARLEHDLRRRRVVAGRSARQNVEDDVLTVLGGLRRGVTLGSPIAVTLANRDHDRWRDDMAAWPNAGAKAPPLTTPRPGHADLAGWSRLATGDLRDVIERASARETAMRTALGGFCRAPLAELSVHVTSFVDRIGDAHGTSSGAADLSDFAAVSARADASPVRALDAALGQRMQDAIEGARRSGDTLGGALTVLAVGMPPGVGSFAQADLRLSARLCDAVGSIHAIKAVGIGDAWHSADATGRSAHDAILLRDGALSRGSNHAGGIEGGVTNGMPVLVRAVMKPLATVAGGLESVDLSTGAPARGLVERTDTCAVPAAAVVAEALVCLVLADALLVAFGGDNLGELRAAVSSRRAGHRR